MSRPNSPADRIAERWEKERAAADSLAEGILAAKNEIVAAALEQAAEGYGIRPRLGTALAVFRNLKREE